LNSENLTLKSQLDSTIYEVRVTSNAIKKLEAKSVFNTSLQDQLKFLRAQKSSLENREDSLIEASRRIEEEKQETIQELNLEKADKELALKEKSILETKVDKASSILANSFSVRAYKTSNSDKVTQTFKANDTKQLELCFVIAENVLAPQGDKELYIQVIDPDNNVVADKGAVNFGDESLIFSTNEKFHYSYSALDVCLTIQNDEDFKTGN
jgi:hypothetical protein